MRKLSSIDSLMLKHKSDIKRMQLSLHRDNYHPNEISLAKAWHSSSAANLPEKENPDTVKNAWDDLPLDDNKLLIKLKLLLGLKPRWHYYLVYFLSYLIIGILLAWGSQFLVYDEVIKRVSSRLSSPAIGSAYYPSADDVNNKPKITVFAIDDNDLNFYKNTYPLPYSFHARMLDSLDALSPKAVFLDIWFHDQRDDPSIGALVDSICRLHKNGTRVYLATVLGLAPNESDLRPELQAITAKATGPNSLAKKTGACAVKVAVGKNVDDLDRQTWRYDLVGIDSSQKIFSAAAQMYNDLPNHEPLKLSANPLALIWGVKGANINQNPYGSRETDFIECRNTWYRAEAIPIPLVLTRLITPDETSKPFCNYHATLPLSALGKIPGETLEPLVKDRMIVYGGNLQSIDDVLYSPVHGRIPGLHMHAMALDNLIQFGNEYPQAEEFDIKKPLSAGTLFAFTVVTFFSLLATIAQWSRSTHLDNPYLIYGWSDKKYKKITQDSKFIKTITQSSILRWAFSKLLLIASIMVMIFIMAWIGLKFFHLGPLSWMEYAISPIAMEFLHVGSKVAAHVHPWIISRTVNIKKRFQK